MLSRFFILYIAPFFGTIMTNDANAYNHLGKSIMNFPSV